MMDAICFAALFMNFAASPIASWFCPASTASAACSSRTVSCCASMLTLPATLMGKLRLTAGTGLCSANRGLERGAPVCEVSGESLVVGLQRGCGDRHEAFRGSAVSWRLLHLLALSPCPRHAVVLQRADVVQEMSLAKVKRKQKPEGWDMIEGVLEQLDNKMRDVESGNDKDLKQTTWEVFRIHHQRSRYVYEMYHKKKAISRELYDFCIREKVVDGNLIAKWKKDGYEQLCCLRCIQPKDTNYGTTCICRVPKKDLDQFVECVSCGCHGCGGE
jgi:bud site selection protein 31